MGDGRKMTGQGGPKTLPAPMRQGVEAGRVLQAERQSDGQANVSTRHRLLMQSECRYSKALEPQ